MREAPLSMKSAAEVPYRSSLEARAEIAEQKDVLKHLREEVAGIRGQIWNAYPIPSLEAARAVTDSMDKGLLRVADLAREFGRHHKNYHVGAVMIGAREPTQEDPNPWAIMFDANTKLDKDGVPTAEAQKWCAEMNLFDRAEGEGPLGTQEKLQNIYSLLVVGVPRAMDEDPVGLMDDRSKKKQVTLTCCGLCRDRMAKMLREQGEKRILSQDTEVITARADSGEDMPLRKYQMVRDLPPFHGEQLPEGTEEMD